MLVRLYRKLRTRLDRLKKSYAEGKSGTFSYAIKLFFIRFAIQVIVFPHFLALGPFKTFVTFARKDDKGSWIDSYNDFIISNKITLAGIIALILIGLVAILVFIYLPILYV